MSHNTMQFNSCGGSCSCRNCRKDYGFWKFLLDCLLVCFTGGFWLIWIFIREMRNR